MSTAVGRLVRAELKLMTRDPLVLTFVFAFPIVTMLIIGGAFGTAPNNPGFDHVNPAHWYVASYLTVRGRFGFDVVGECADGGEVGAAVDALAPDVVLMDVRMPFVDGVQATVQLKRRDGSPPVLALTTFDDEEALAGMLRAGASGFVLKGVPAEDLQRAVRVVAEGGAWLDPAVTGRVLATYRTAPASRPPSATAPRDKDLDALTSRELEVLALIGRGKTNGEIAAELYVGEGTVKTHINHLFTKLRLRDRAAAVVFAYDHGLVER